MPDKIAMAQKSNFTGQLQDLDEHVSAPGFSISAVAAQDQLFLQHKAVSFNTRTIREASHILDVSTQLIERLQYTRTERLWDSSEYKCIDRSQCEKYLANLEHLLLCFQHAAFEALVHSSLERLQHDYQHWRRYLEQQSKVHEEYFSEWVGGRPPLNSTMPWNIKPSLVVLWGVCWMFYAQNDNSVSPEGARQRRGSESAWQRQATASWPQGYGMPTQSPTTRQPSGASVSQPHVPSMAVGLGLQVTDSPVTHTMYQTDAEAVGSYAHQPPQQPIASQYGPPGGAPPLHQVKPTPYIKTANITPSSSSDASFPASSPAWNQDQGSTHAYAVGNQVWQPSPSPNLSTPTTGFSYPHGAAAVAAQIPPFDATASAASNQQYPRPFSATNYINPYPYTSFVPMSTDRTYPPSPHSEASARSGSLMPMNVPETMLNSPQRHDASSYSPDDGHDNLPAGSREPPRDQFNQIFCDHEECGQNPPNFARKCEWSKHMDKHNRPYRCPHPGCEKIRGFTYSGGLLRHEREVHRKYGGPKAPRFCPHKDCKRSTGQGFSRKENLHEHLRRVHRGIGIHDEDNVGGAASTSSTSPTAATDPATSIPIATAMSAPQSAATAAATSAPAPAVSTATSALLSVPAPVPEQPEGSGTMRKRKRPSFVASDEQTDDVDAEILREENKRLRQQIAERDQRLHMLENLLYRYMGQNQARQMMQPQT